MWKKICDNFFWKDTIADIRQQLDNLYSKKRSYGVYVAKKKAEISEMVQEVIFFHKSSLEKNQVIGESQEVKKPSHQNSTSVTQSRVSLKCLEFLHFYRVQKNWLKRNELNSVVTSHLRIHFQYCNVF